MKDITDKVIFPTLIVILVGCLVLGVVSIVYEKKEENAFQAYMQQKGYVRTRLKGETMMIKASEVQELALIVKEYLEATKQVE
jgi:hypothetical protein